VFKRSDVKDIYKLTPMQQGMLFHTIIEADPNAYFQQAEIWLEGDVEVTLLEKSFDLMIERYDVLRTVFLFENVNEPMQVVLKSRKCEVNTKDIRGMSEDDIKKYVAKFREADSKKGFNLTKDILIRLAVLRISETGYRLIWSYHHIIMDGWCLGILLGDFFKIYKALKDGKEPKLPRVYPYSNFIRWLERQDIQEAADYWKRYLEGYEQPTPIHRNKAVEEYEEYDYREAETYLDEERTKALESLAGKLKVTVNSIIRVVWAVILQQYNNTEDVVFGSVVSGRPPEIEGIEKMVGLFINTVPIRVIKQSDESFAKFVTRLQAETQKAARYDYYALADIQAQTVVKQNLLDHILVFENYPIEKEAKDLVDENLLGFKISNVKMYDRTSYNFNILVIPGKRLNMQISYNGKLYAKDRIEAILGHILNVTEKIIENPNISVDEIEILTEEEKRQILVEFNSTKEEYPREKTIHELFEEQVEKTPKNVAVKYYDKFWTYRELNNKANHVAIKLREMGVCRDNAVGIMTKRSSEMIAAMLGILKAGGAILPIDPEYPVDRIKHIIKDGKAQVLICERKENLLFKGKHFYLEDIDNSCRENQNLNNVNKPEDLLYIIYTSGSTGKPKGVMIEHKNMVNLVYFEYNNLNINFGTKVMQFTTCCFDVCYQEIFSTLLRGGELNIINDEQKKNPYKLMSFVEKTGIEVLFLPTSYVKYMASENDMIDNLPNCVKCLITAGEQLIINDKLKKIITEKNIDLHNHYGPSETHVVTTFFINAEAGIQEIPPIGKPINNTRVYIMGNNNKLVPIGVTGEMYLAGDCVGRGYVNMPELTAKKFIKDPFVSNQRMYKTGDMGRWMPDGNIEFIGRSDHQIKIRGYRVELGEIESRLLGHKDVKEVVIVIKRDGSGDKYITAYFVANRQMTVGELRGYLKSNLPEYMIPSYFVQLDVMPLTPNGKIDRKVLPEPKGLIDTGVEYKAPRNELEQKLVELWQDILKVERIGINDNFFELGGHSLKAIILVARIQKELEVKIPLKEIFAKSTIKNLAQFIDKSEQNDYISIKQAEKKEYYPVSSAQKRIYTLQQFDIKNTAYNMPVVINIEGELDLEKLESVFKKLLNRHESLRTSFKMQGEELIQKINKNINFEIEYVEEKEEAIICKRIRTFVRPFDLSEAPLFRVGLIKVQPKKHILMYDIHHIICDGASMNIIFREISTLYEKKELKDLNIQYKDYAEWQNKLVHEEYYKNQGKYWLDRFKGEIPVLNMPTDYPRQLIQSFEGSSLRFEIKEELTKGIRKLSQQTESTIYMILLAAYNVFLSKYSGQEDIIVGSPITGRFHADLENIIGMFVNTLAMRNRPEGKKSFAKFLQEVKEGCLQAYENQSYQFDELVENLEIKRDIARNPLFDTLFVMQNIQSEEILVKDVVFKPWNRENETVKFDLSIDVIELQDTIALNIEYCSKLFNKETVNRFSKHYINILREIVENPKISIEAIDMLTEEEKSQLLVEFNNTKAEYPKDKTIHQIFEEQVEKTPERIAVKYRDKHLTYTELNCKANKLAKKLRVRGIRPDTIVAMLVERSLEMVIGIYGILKAGGAYLPIDPHYPSERIQYLIDDSETQIVLTQERFTEKVNGVEVINLEDESLYMEDGINLEIVNKPTDLAYVIYTSGSTGKPKGVMIEHCSVINKINWRQKKYPIGQDDVILQKTPYTFDVSVWELIWWSFAGATVSMLEPGGEKAPSIIKKAIEENMVTTMHFVPSMLNAFLQYLKIVGDANGMSSLKRVFASGEALTTSQVKQFNKLINKETGARLYNLYGPTEATIEVSYYDCPETEEIGIIPLGKPIDNIEIYILDQNNKLQPIGIPGELHIAGDGLARGYLNRSELTEEKFIPNPIKQGQRMYKTGDLARWQPDGNIEFMGRIDYQVKIRGNRIELGEIESKLLDHEEIKDAVVIAREEKNGEKYLTAYFVANRQLTVGELRQYLNNNLPEYMVPQYFVQLDKMPLTSNGKIDRKVMPDPEVLVHTGVEYEAPRNKTEEKLAEIWQDILKVKRIGINDNFFELGGHSLKATIIMARIEKELEVKVSIKEIFTLPTVKELAVHINRCQKSQYYSIKTANKREYYPVSSIQKRLYTLQNIDLDETAYNMPQVLVLEGNIDKEIIENTFKKLVCHHEILRTSFKFIEGKIFQKVHDAVNFNVEYYEEDKKTRIEFIVRNFIRPFNLEQAPLIRGGLIKINSKKYILMTDIHHIVSDGTSIEILIHDFIRLYEGKELNELKLQYKDYAVWQSEILKKEQMQVQEKYWLNEFAGEIPVLSMPLDKVRPSIKGSEGDNYHFTIEENLLKDLKDFALRNQVTIFMVFLEAFSLTLSKYSGQEDIIIGTVTAGREHADIQNLMGVFLNSIAFRCMPQKEKTAEHYLQEIKQTVLKGYENQSYPIEEIIDKLNLNRDLSRNALFDVMLIYQNYEKQEKVAKSMNFSIHSYESKYYSADYDMTMYIEDIKDRLQIDILYYSGIFEKASIERFAGHFNNILKALVKKPDSKLKDIDIMSKEEMQRVLVDFNKTSIEYPRDKSIKQLIEEMVEKVPDKTAVIFEDNQLTYQQLNQKSNQLASMLRGKGIKNNCIVGIMMDRSVEMIIAVLAVIKSGGAYLTIDTEYPNDRIVYMLKDSNVRILLTDQTEGISQEYFNINVKDVSLYQGDDSNLDCINKPMDLVYIVYTSGTTGKPKGVMVEHRNLLNMVYEWKRSYGLDEFDVRLLQIASISFDLFTGDLMRVFTNAGTMVICPKEVRLDSAELYNLIQKHGVNILESSPAVIIPMMEYIYANKLDISSMKILILGGDSYSVEDFIKINERFSNTMWIINNYGVTEGTIDSSFYEINKSIENMSNVPIGKPMQNTKFYILDECRKPKAIGHYGELYIGGEGVARGYLNKPELTVEKFMDDPFTKSGTMYKTGDMARWLPDGNVEFVGRIDNQVKIRGYRIELGEIENCLRSYKEVKEVVVTVKEDKWDKFLCAYLVSDSLLDIGLIRKKLTRMLPNYMIPSYFTQIDKIPYTLNGKIDRAVLPAPEGVIDTGIEYEAPRSDVEQKLVEIWEDILKVEKIGVNDNFFELGGHSLKATTLVARVQKELEVKVPLKEIFEKPTIRGLAEYIDCSEKNRYDQIKQVEEKDYYPVSSAQKRMYVLQQFNLESIAYNISDIIELEGNLDIIRLEECFKKLIIRHETLRTSFEIINGEIVQKIHRYVNFKIEYSEEIEKEKIIKFVRPFDLSKAPLLRVGLIKIHPKKYILMYDIHHIISDGTSMGIINKEISAIYQDKRLEKLEIQYKDYAEWQNKLIQGELYKKQEKYWLEQFKGEIPVLNLPTDYDRKTIQDTEGESLKMEFGKKLSEMLEKMAKETGTTLYMVLLAAYYILLHKFSGQVDIVVGSPIAGRPHADLEKIIGMFVNTLAMRNKPEGKKTFKELLLEVRKGCLEAYENQNYQFEELVEKLKVKRDIGRNPLFDTLFAVQNMENEATTINDIIFKPFKVQINTKVKIDIAFIILEGSESLKLYIEYMSTLFNRETIEILGEKYLIILKNIVTNPNVYIKDIILSEKFIVSDSNILKDDEGDFNFDK